MYGIVVHLRTRLYGRNEVAYTFLINTLRTYLYLFILHHPTQYNDRILQLKSGMIEILH